MKILFIIFIIITLTDRQIFQMSSRIRKNKFILIFHYI